MLKKKDMLSFALRRRKAFEALIYIDSLSSKSTATKTPMLSFTLDERSFASDKQISIGLGGFKAVNEAELYLQITHMIGVQLQHLHSTVRKDWDAAEKLALKGMCEKLARDFIGKPVKFSQGNDYERFFEDLESKGVYLSVHTIKEVIAYIAGTLEEGRVERIHTEKFPTFIEDRRVVRELQYRNKPLFPEGIDPIPYEMLNPAEKLKALQKQISFLATRERFQRGFLSNYIDTEFYDEMKKFLPHISKAISAATCRECMEEAGKILDLMYDDIVRAASFKGGIEEMMKEMLSAMANAPDMSKFSASPSDEEKGSGEKPESLFGDSDLEVTLEDEDYDKLMNQDNGSQQNDEDGMRIKRKHDYDQVPPTQQPKQNPQNQQNQQNGEQGQQGDGMSSEEDANPIGDSTSGQKSSAAGSSSKSGEEESSESSEGSEGSSVASSKEGEEQDGKGSGCSSAGESEDGESEDSAAASAGSGEEGEEAGEKGASAGSEGDSAEESGPDASGSDGNSKGESKEASADSMSADKSGSAPVSDFSGKMAGKSPEDIAAEIEKAMQEAMRNAEKEIKRSEKYEKLEKDFQKKLDTWKPEPLTPFDPSNVNAKYQDRIEFAEVERVYKPDQMLPYNLDAKGKSLKRKVEEIIRNKQIPDRRGMRSGSIDGTRLYKLIQSETTVFKKRGEKVKPDVAGFLLLDNSGSMGNGPGSTRYYACNALSVVEEGFKEFMPLKIAAFDSFGANHVNHEIIKDFEEVAPCNLTHNFCVKGRTGGRNKDGYSIRVATEQLLARPEKDKILIIASDGLPSSYSGAIDGASGTEDVRNAVAEARKKGIKVVGMYMYHSGSDSRDFDQYQEMYREDYIMATMDDIEKELTRIMKKLFI